ncbi:ankyrin repeat domain-containing protein 54-like [Anthonomus grandis grandis]|uniref:ankyrin repeat domain-containing protein 54-like n=1 Tax=Anthonomus grandis grandis TaxID=2921223 RepID=UPI0021653646|nr:ankyrin repeat domain-containing protein 54-like [Anthonomus grandis grandis]
MSHSDSEIKDVLKDKRHKQLQLEFRTKKRIGGEPPLKTITKIVLSKRKSLYLDPIKQEFRLVRAVSLNNTNEVKRMLDQGVSPNSMDNERRSALHVAVSKGYSEIVKLLLHYGADPNKRDMIQNTPLHLAACVHNLPIISMLINAKADVSCLDLHGRNPLQLASSKLQILRKGWRDGSIEMVKLREELQQVIDLLLSFLIRGVEERMERLNRNRVNVDELQMVKMTLNTGPAEQLDNQMTKLLEDIEKFQIK